MFFSALFYGAAYYLTARIAGPSKRALLAAPLALLLMAGMILYQNPNIAASLTADWRAIVALIAIIPGIGFWAWRTRASDLRELAKE